MRIWGPLLLPDTGEVRPAGPCPSQEWRSEEVMRLQDQDTLSLHHLLSLPSPSEPLPRVRSQSRTQGGGTATECHRLAQPRVPGLCGGHEGERGRGGLCPGTSILVQAVQENKPQLSELHSTAHAAKKGNRRQPRSSHGWGASLISQNSRAASRLETRATALLQSHLETEAMAERSLGDLLKCFLNVYGAPEKTV